MLDITESAKEDDAKCEHTVTSSDLVSVPCGADSCLANVTNGRAEGLRPEKRSNTTEGEQPWTMVTGSSCHALKCAVSTLHRLDDFNMEKIGSGFFSEVFKVTHKVSGSVMVLKMNLLRSNRPNMLKEVQLMNQLKHKNILKFKGVCVHEGQLHALTEYINGGSLEQLIQARSIELSYLTRQKLSLDIASGMEYLHGKGVFHRDLTSKNVLIKTVDPGTSVAVVGDFGLAAKIPDPKCKYRLSTVGSAYWMSPECLKGQWYNEKSDIFSYGIVLCEMIARIEADPDILPRTDNFGLDYLAFSDLCGPCPPHFLKLAFSCCTFEPKSRPSFSEIVSTLERLTAEYEEVSKAEMMESTKLVNAGSLNNLIDVDEKCSMTARSEEVINKCASAGKDPCHHRKLHHRRSLSEDVANIVFPRHTAPSDKARCHQMLSPKQQTCEVLANPKHIGESMCEVDPHYKPRLSHEKGSRSNPFLALSQFRGAKKIVGSQNLQPNTAGELHNELFSSCFELPSPFYGITPPSSPSHESCSCGDTTCIAHGAHVPTRASSSPSHVELHRCRHHQNLSFSLPCSPTAQRKVLAQLETTKQSNPSSIATPVIPKKLMKSKTVPLIKKNEAPPTEGAKTEPKCRSTVNNISSSFNSSKTLPSTMDFREHLPNTKESSEVSSTLAVCTRVSSSSTNLLELGVDDSFLLTCGVQLKRRGSCESGFFSCVGEDFGGQGSEVLSSCEYVLQSARQRQLDNSSATLSSSSAASSLFLMDDSLSTTTVSSLRSGSGDFTELDDLPSRLTHHSLLFSTKHSSSLCTDSSEDISTMGDLSEDKNHSRYQSQQISKIVEYFERKHVTTMNHRNLDATLQRRRNLNLEFQKNIQRFDPSKCDEEKIQWEGLEGKFKKSGMGLTQRRDLFEDKPLSKVLYDVKLKKLSQTQPHHHDVCKKLEVACSISDAIRKSKIELLRKSLERGTLHVPGIRPSANTTPNERSATRPLTTRLMICEGAVKSKLPLFDKK